MSSTFPAKIMPMNKSANWCLGKYKNTKVKIFPESDQETYSGSESGSSYKSESDLDNEESESEGDHQVSLQTQPQMDPWNNLSKRLHSTLYIFTVSFSLSDSYKAALQILQPWQL